MTCGAGPSLASPVVADPSRPEPVSTVEPDPAVDTDADEYDRRRRRTLWSMPSGLYLLGSRSGDERNLMTLNWATQVASEPKLVAVSVERQARTHRLVADGGAFALSILDRSDRAVVRKFVRPATWDARDATLNGFKVGVARTGVPVLAGAGAWLDCEVRDRLDWVSHTLFVGEVVDCRAPSDGFEALRMEDTKMSYGG